jgi:NADPH:quinone reductase-like Zn-dependent oxidoreductase
MKAALIHEAGAVPVYTDFREPESDAQLARVKVSASALSHVTRSRASGNHYSSTGKFPLVPGIDGVGTLENGTRIYFMLPEAPFGGMAEYCLIDRRRCIALPDGLDDVAAAAMAIPGMSSWAAFAERARLVKGETVLINGATGSSGSLAVQIAKHFGAGKVIATGRNPDALRALHELGADVTVDLRQATNELQRAFEQQFEEGVDVVIDYLWGPSAELLLTSAAKVAPDAVPIRYVEIGAISAPNITLPSAIIRSTAIELMGSGIGSIPMPRIVEAIHGVLAAAVPASFKIATKAVPLSEVARYWSEGEARARTVFTMGGC